ncbi:type II toxin-antitoxin system HicB family antitoxin (plasmid) [Streptomyces longwoodensis]|uniref:hypothetical protein n=1 Tax=Streptomyces longwoodensis TaxID=68231 RepID=UPI002ED67202|nr:type II toxin-antitoxin system HicB family antitoxin [Streptomyces longwoodensis]
MIAYMPRPYGSRDAHDRDYVPPVADSKSKNKLVRLSPLVPPEVHARAFANAKASGVTMGKYIAELIRRDQLDQSGRPVWASEAFGEPDQGELPMTG